MRLLGSIEQPVLVVLDDLQWASPTSLDVLCHVARRALDTVIVGLYRGRELDISYPLARCLGEVNRRRGAEYVRLSGLDRADAATLLEDVSDTQIDPELAEDLFRATRGNPFYLHELGRNVQQPGGVGGLARWTPPETIQQAVALSLADVSAPTRSVLELASVFSGGFGFEELHELSELDEDALLLCVDEALAADLIRPVAAERYEFAHAVFGHTLYARLNPSRRARLHRRLAEIIEHIHAGRTAAVAAELAHQYHGSITLPGAERGVPHALAAARQARAAGEPGEAVKFSRIALDLGAEDDDSTKAEILAGLALSQAQAGMVGEALRSADRALPFVREGDDAAEAAANFIYEVISQLRVSVPRQEALAPLIARGLADLAGKDGLVWARLKLFDRADDPLEGGPIPATRWRGLDPEAVRIVRVDGAPDDYLRTVDWHAALTMPELEELIPRVESWSDPAVRLPAMVAVAHHLLMRQGPSPEVDRLCTECEALADELGSIPGKAVAAIQRGMFLGEQGRLEAAAARIADATAAEARLGPMSLTGIAATLVGALTSQHIDPDWRRTGEQARSMALAAEPVFWGVACAAFAAHAFAKAGMREDAGEMLGHVVPLLEDGGLAPYAQSIGVSLAASAAAELSDAERAETLLGCAQSLFGEGDWYMASSELAAARLAATLGDTDAAIEYFGRARETLARRGQVPLAAIVDHDEGLMRRSAHQAGGSRMLASAERRFTELGMTEWSMLAAKDPGGLPDDLTRREAEVLRLLAAGSTNNEIAEALVVSVHTVERHVTNAYRKIAVRNRADATGYVLRTGL